MLLCDLQIVVASKFDNRLKEFAERWEVDRYLSASGYLHQNVKPFFVALPKVGLSGVIAENILECKLSGSTTMSIPIRHMTHVQRLGQLVQSIRHSRQVHCSSMADCCQQQGSNLGSKLRRDIVRAAAGLTA